jgi:hypothetical protein
MANNLVGFSNIRFYLDVVLTREADGKEVRESIPISPVFDTSEDGNTATFAVRLIDVFTKMGDLLVSSAIDAAVTDSDLDGVPTTPDPDGDRMREVQETRRSLIERGLVEG